MDQRNRIFIVVIILLLFVMVVMGVDYLQRRSAASRAPAEMPPGSIPIFVDGEFFASFVVEDLQQLQGASFVDAEEGKTQEGWLLRDVLWLYLDESGLQPDTQIAVSSSSRDKTQILTWAEIENPENSVLFDLSGRSTLKLVSKIPGFDIRDAWIQDVDQIEVTQP